MGDDLAKADAMNPALAHERNRAAHYPVSGGLLLADFRLSAAPRAVGHENSLPGGDDDRHRICYRARHDR